MHKEAQSIDTPFNKIRPSEKLLANYSILFMLWGWAGVLKYILDYIEKYAYISISLRQSIHILGYFVIISWLGGTLYFLFKHSKMKLTYFGWVLRFIWFSLVLCMVMLNLIQMNVLQEVNFELQHPIIMVFYAFATLITGAVLRQKTLIMGGIIFAICAFLSSYMELKDQLTLETIAWMAAFVVPGHIMYSKARKEKSILLYQ